ncbi:hypothetical protein IV203_029298 [Nitzschia inconspicua]|uniref:Uncharacterized protein n=1 Tax=Nitzschia inconspicua TaxID=303405 RepID=A0A9K3Q0K9_9STRA|nr:hypothetical protein IV203_029298 [Nitzschia inconspicua]
MRRYLVHALLFLVVSNLAVTPSVAVRGTTKIMTRRSLQQVAKDPITPPEKKESKDNLAQDKAEKEDVVPKESEPKKGAKKEKKACKKAAAKVKKAKKDTRRQLQTTEEVEENIFAGDVAKLMYCSQGELSATQCANLAGIPSDGKVASVLKIGLVHSDQKHPQTIVEEAQAILDSGEIESRFVGCKDMDIPPPLIPPKKSDSKTSGPSENAGTRRTLARLSTTHNHRMLPLDEHEVILRTPEEEIDVVGVDFHNLMIVRGGCENDDLPKGVVCDIIESDINIYYKSASGQDPNDKDREDMHNLLIETIVRQADAGVFVELGSVESVEVGSVGSSDGSGDEIPLGPIIGGVLASVLLAGSVYFFCCRSGTHSNESPKGQNDDTSDEEQYTSSDEEEDKKRRQSSIPEAQVIAVEDIAAKTDDFKKKKQGC